MDYTELVLEQCPEVVAEYVTSVDPDGLAPTLWPNDDFQGMTIHWPAVWPSQATLVRR